MGNKQDLIFVLIFVATVAAVILTIYPLSQPLRPDVTVRASLSK